MDILKVSNLSKIYGSKVISNALKNIKRYVWLIYSSIKLITSLFITLIPTRKKADS